MVRSYICSIRAAQISLSQMFAKNVIVVILKTNGEPQNAIVRINNNMKCHWFSLFFAAFKNHCEFDHMATMQNAPCIWCGATFAQLHRAAQISLSQMFAKKRNRQYIIGTYMDFAQLYFSLSNSSNVIDFPIFFSF